MLIGCIKPYDKLLKNTPRNVCKYGKCFSFVQNVIYYDVY